MFIRDLSGREYSAVATTDRDIILNGDQSLDVYLSYNKVNKDFIADLDRLWTFVDNDETEYKIIFYQRQGQGEYQKVKFKAIPTFFDTLKADRIYEEYNGSITFNRACTLLFKNTPFTFVQQSQFNSVEWEGFGAGEEKIETFKRILNRYKAEFKIIGNIVYFKDIIGDDTNIMYAHRLNASDIVVDVDASNFYTYAKGYGNFTEEDGWQSAKLIREYISPIEKVIGRRRHAPPIKNGKITVRKTMDDNLKAHVEESLKISISLTMHQLREQGYEDYIPNVGDRIFIVDHRIGLNDEVRVQQAKIKRNWKNDVIDYQAVVGAPSVVRRYQSQLSTAIKNITDIVEGNTKLPFNVLDNAVINATKALQNAETELQFPKTGGILAVDKRNPNLVTLYNSAGIGVSNDGGRTFKNAITGEGIVAEAILAGVVQGLILEGGEVLGGKFTTTGGNSHIEIENGVLKTFDDGNLTSQLSGKYHTFYRDDKIVGHIGTDNWVNDPNYKGLVFYADEADFFGWGVKNEETGTFDLALSWHRNNLKGNEGININAPTYINSNDFNVGNLLKMKSTSNGLRIGVNVDEGSGTYIYLNTNGQVGFVHNGTVYESFNP